MDLASSTPHHDHPYSSPCHSLPTAANLAVPLFLKHDKHFSPPVHATAPPAPPGHLLRIPQVSVSIPLSQGGRSSLTPLASRGSPCSFLSQPRCLLFAALLTVVIAWFSRESCCLPTQNSQLQKKRSSAVLFATVLPPPAQGLTEQTLKYFLLG